VRLCRFTKKEPTPKDRLLINVTPGIKATGALMQIAYFNL
jgi:hypothetical protein